MIDAGSSETEKLYRSRRPSCTPTTTILAANNDQRCVLAHISHLLPPTGASSIVNHDHTTIQL